MDILDVRATKFLALPYLKNSPRVACWRAIKVMEDEGIRTYSKRYPYLHDERHRILGREHGNSEHDWTA